MSKITVDTKQLAAIRKAIYHLGNTLSTGSESDYQLVESTALMVTDIIRDAELFDIGILKVGESFESVCSNIGKEILRERFNREQS